MTGDPVFTIEKVTPAKASAWLKRNVANRRVSPKVVRNYADDMSRGEWLLNGEAIKFDQDGDLLDGQHRLGAIVYYGKPVRLAICRNLPRAVFKTIDSGKKRGHADIVGLRGVRYPAAVATAYRMLFFYPQEQWSGGKPGKLGRMTNTQLEAVIALHPEVLDLVETVFKKPYYTSIITQSALLFSFYLASKVDGELAEEFFQELAALNSRKSGAAAALRARLLEVNDEVFPPPPGIKLAWLIQAWNAYVAGRTPKRFSRMILSMPRFEPEPKFRRR